MKDFFKLLSIKGVVLGFLAQAIALVILAMIVGWSILYFQYGGEFINQWSENRDKYEDILEPIFSNYGEILYIISLIFGGYIAACTAKKGIYINSGLIGLIIILFNVTKILDPTTWSPIELSYIFHLLIVIPAAVFGGHLAKGKVQTLVANQKTEGSESTET